MPSRVLLAVLAVGVAAGCGSSTSPAAGAAASPFTKPTTVTYCTDGGMPLTLDLFEPAAAAPHPLLVVIHGGSWAFGDSRMTAQSALTQQSAALLLARGFAVASINYRLAPRDPWPAQIIDTRCALRYLRETASRWQLDPHRFAALGNSAGGQLASLLALSDGRVPQWDNGQHPGRSTAVRAVVDLWGPEDLAAPGWDAQAVKIGAIVFRAAWGSQSPVLADASPVNYINAHAPGFLIIQGSADTLVPASQSEELHARLAAAGDQATLVEVANAGHELVPSGGVIAPTVDSLASQVADFVGGTA